MTQEDYLKSIYRDFLKAETARPEVGHEKKIFLERFSEEPFIAWQPSFMIPAFALFFLCLFFHQIQTRNQAASVLPLLQSVLRKNVETLKRAESVPSASWSESLEKKSPVLIKRVTSRVGPTLVYHKDYHGLPVTIIWVFSK